ncbi:hypothetical protein RQP46_011220 [Phenoliferia psychrophenolica]
MSTAGRINKGATKFVPKRKVPSAVPRASSATPSLAATPRFAASVDPSPLSQIDELALEAAEPAPVASGSGSGSGGGKAPPAVERESVVESEADHEVFLAPPVKVVPTNSPFAPSDPSAARAANLAIAPTSAPTAKKVAAPIASPALPAPSSSAAAEPRTQREIEQEALELEKAAAAKKEAANLKRREAAKAKREGTAKASKEKGKGKGKKRAEPEPDADAADAEPGQDEDEDAVAPPPVKKARKSRAKSKAKAVEEDAEDGEAGAPEGEEDGPMLPPPAKAKRVRNPRQPKVAPPVNSDGEVDAYDAAQPKKRKRKNKTGERVQASKMDIALFGTPAEDGSGDDDNDEDAEDEGESSSSEEDDPDLSAEEGSDGEMRPRRRKKLVRTKRRHNKKKKRTGSPERVAVDEDVTTMSQLATARDSLSGRVSSRGMELMIKVEEKKRARRDARAKMRIRAAKNTRRARGESVSEDEDDEDEDLVNSVDKRSQTPSRKGSPTPSLAGSRNATPGPAPRIGSPAALNLGADKENDGTAGSQAGEEDDDDDYGDLVETEYAPQMRIVDGELVIDDSSLEVDRSARAEATFTGQREVIEESANDRLVNSGTWGKQVRTEKWTSDETELFYDLLHQFGTDFEMIAAMFPHRSRRQIKAKWTKEDKQNPKLITAALMRKKPIDQAAYSKATGLDLSGPVPDDPFEAIQKVREELAAKAALSGEPIYGQQHVPTGVAKKGGKAGQRGKGKGRARFDGDEGSDDGGFGAELDGVGEDDEEEEEQRRLQEEREQAEVDAQIAEAEARERAEEKQRKRAAVAP